jgi:hypothetical protein
MEAGRDVYYLIGGDFNARVGDWCLEGVNDEFEEARESEFERETQDVVVNNFGKRLIQLCSMFNFVPLNGLVEQNFDGNFTFFSERGNSTIDLFLSSVDFVSFVKSLKVVGRVESQHMPVQLDACAVLKENPKTEPEITRVDKLTWDPQKAHLFLDFLNSDVGQHALDDATAIIDDDSEAALGKFVNLLIDASQCMRRSIIVGGRARRDTNRWFDKECRDSKREVRRLLNRYMRTRKIEDKILYTQKKTAYQDMIKEKKKKYKETVQESLFNARNDSSAFWSTIKKARSRKTNRAPINIDVWKTHFEQVLGQHTAPATENNHTDVNDGEDDDVHVYELDEEISLNEVKSAIHRLKSGKASGLDNISAESLKAAENIIAPFLVKLFNRLFETGVFPKEWSQSVIIPLFKKGDANNPENYRGISLLSIVSKIFTSILNKRLYNWAEKEHKICEEQAGFRKSYATVDHVYTLMSMIKKSLFGLRKSKFYVAFIDYQKAFDSVDRESLWLVLKKIKTSTKMLRMLQGIYGSVQACVKWGSDVSEFFDCPLGVKQGCMLSPLIFSLLITEVADAVTKKGKHGFQFLPGLQEIFLLLFADDICLISTTPAGLQNQLDNLEKASTPLGLTVNLKKTKVMVFRKGGHLGKFEKWYFQGKELEVVNSYKYLGFTFTTKLSFEIALEEFAGRAKGKVVEIMKTMWSLGTLDINVFFKLFDAQVKPMLLYAAEIWGFVRFHVVEAPHLFACKRFLNVSPRTPNTMVYGELGRYPLYIDSAVRAVKYWFKLQNMMLVRLPRQAYEMEKTRFLRQENKENVQNWVYCLKHCFDIFGFSEVWINGGVGDEKVFVKVLRERMVDCYKQDWWSKLASSERYSTYNTLKSLLQQEQYFNGITIVKFRNSFVKFRLGIADININKRYQNASKDCPFCKNVVEDELHFLLYCDKYNELRDKYISKHCTNAFMPMLPFLLQNDNKEITRSVAMYIFYALKTREQLLSIN